MLKVKKIFTVLLVLSILLTAASCGSKADKETVLQKADYFAKAVSTLDSDRLVNSVDEIDYNTAKNIRNKTDISYLDDDHKLVTRVIAGSIAYEIDADSLEFSDDGKSAEVDIKFTIVDYKAVIKAEDLKKASDIARTLGRSNIKLGYIVRCGLVYSGERWCVTCDTLRNLADLYSFLDDTVQVGYTSEDIRDLIDNTRWMMDPDNGTFTNVSYLEFYAYIKEDPEFDYYYVYKYNGKELYRSDVKTAHGYVSCYFEESNGAVIDDGYLAGGEYEVTIYGSDDVIISSDKVTVIREKPRPSNPELDGIVADPGTAGYVLDVGGVMLRVNTDMNEYLPLFDKAGVKYDLLENKTVTSDIVVTTGGDDDGLFSNQIDLAGPHETHYLFRDGTVYVNTVEMNGKSIITYMSLSGDAKTTEGISFGDSREDVVAKYGPAVQDTGYGYEYIIGDTKLSIGFTYDGKVDTIRYMSKYFQPPVSF